MTLEETLAALTESGIPDEMPITKNLFDVLQEMVKQERALNIDAVFQIVALLTTSIGDLERRIADLES